MPNSKTVLVVDDDESLRSAIVFDLKRRGFNVLSAENGKEGLRLLKANQVNLVISDLNMPDGDGLTLLEKIRDRDAKEPEVILMSATPKASEEEYRRKGARSFVSKPFKRSVLLAAILVALGLK